MDYPPEEDYDALLEEELEMMKSRDIEDEYEALEPMETQATNANISVALSEPNTESDFGGMSGISGIPVNRRLFGAARGDRITSTPRPKQVPNEHKEIEEKAKRARFDRDIFGVNLYDNESYTDPVAKKMKIVEEQDMETINKILALRQRSGGLSTKTSKRNVFYLQRLHDFKTKNLSKNVPQWPFLIVRSSEHDRIFVRYHTADFEDRSLRDICAKPSTDSLLSESKQRLWNEANEIILKRAQQRSSDDSHNIGNSTNVPDLEEELWVEKYRPQKYIDLLSAETINRSLLLWLKMWDKVVFGREFTPKSNLTEATHKLNTFNKLTKKFESNGGWQQRRPRTNLDTNEDEFGRPVQKVALLHGAPGLGKTTLAHILAKHAGYQPIEINASDDRSPALFQQALENGTQMASLLNENRRPNCIILDEIDGAPRQSIEFLVKFATDNFQVKRHKGTGKPKKNILKRPIICICNDVYEPALRSLRLISFIVNFPPIQVSRLEECLKQIAKRERLKADITALYALAQKTGNDVRSCISVLQFFKSENKAITLQDVVSNKVSRKDQHQGLFTVWSKIFQIQKTSEQSNSFQNITDGNEATESARVRNILDAVQSAGDYQRLMSGIYENFLNQKQPDSNFDGIVDALQWFCFSDRIQSQINHQQNYSIYPYLQFGFAKWHLLFASLAWPKINFPTQGIEFNQKSTTHRNIFDSLRKGMLSSTGSGSFGLEGKALLLEAVPFLKKIISPDLRHLPVELFSQREREDLRHTVEIMADLGLTYIQVKSLEGPYQFQMEPDLEALTKFSGFPGVSLPYFGRQMIARQVEIERIHRAAPKVSGPQSEVKKSLKPKEPEKDKPIPNHLRKLQPKMPIDSGRTNHSGNALSKYFGNILKSSSAQSSSVNIEKPEDPIVKSPIWYHYKEGFNNAVRKDIHMRELL